MKAQASLLALISWASVVHAQTNHALNRSVIASSSHDAIQYPAENAVDGDLSDSSRWLGAASPGGNTLEIELATQTSLNQAHLYSGFQSQSSSTVDAFSFESWDGSAWQAIPGVSVSGSGYFATAFNFENPVTTDRIRLVIADTDINRVREVALWSDPTELYEGVTGSNRPLWVQQGFTNFALGKPVTASSTVLPDEAKYAVDGVVSSSSLWASEIGSGESLEIDLGGLRTLEEAHVYSLLGTADPPGEDLVTFEFTGDSLEPTLGSFAVTHGIAVSDLSLGTFGNLFNNGAGDHLRLSGNDTDYNSTGDATVNGAYLSFTITIPDTVTIDFTSLSADLEVVGVSSYSNARVFSSIDGFDAIADDTIGAIGYASAGSWGPGTQTLDLRDPGNHDNANNVGAGANVTAGDFDGLSDTTITFYLPWIDNFGSVSSYTDLDNLKVQAALQGVGGADPASDFHLESWNGSGWDPIAGASVSDSSAEEHVLTFSGPVTTDRVRLVNDSTATDDSGRLRIRELALWDEPLPLYTGMTGPGISDPTASNIPIVSVNQIGYQSDAPKRFTAPIADDGDAFEIVAEAAPGTVLFSGTIQDGLGDFTSFQPATAGPYVVRYTPVGETDPVESYPFLIQGDFFKEKFVGPLIQFMVDSRSGVGTHPSAFGGAPWRDGTYYSFEIPSLIYLHLSALDVSRASTGELDYAADKALVEDPGYRASFDFTREDVDYGDGDFVTTLENYYSNYDPPLPGCPDALKAVHFGLGITMARPNTRDWSGDPLPRHLHAQAREWFAWFLYAWPAIRDQLPDSFYVACRDFAFTHWADSSGLGDSDLSNNQPSPLDIDPLWDPASYGGHDKHPFKGRHALGHSILPNLLMWQVALREGRSDAATYLTAAQAQTQWVIDNIDWNNPATTKGHRMSEHKLMPGLVHFLRSHPVEAPAGLAAKIESWADVMISRSDNMWDFRRYELSDVDGDGVIDWSIPKQTFNWNEPGNLAGFPACALAAAWTLDHAPAKQQRLRELSQSAIDCLFGRNPLNTGSAGRPQLGFPDQETHWTPIWSGAAGFLDLARAAISSGPASEHFPYQPDGPKRHAEPWVNFNASLNMGVSYLLADRTSQPQPLAVAFPLKITEIMAEPNGDPAAEFIELHNPTDAAVRLSGLTLSGDVDFTVPGGTADLAAGGRCLMVRDEAAFEAVHGAGHPVIGAFIGELDDVGGVLQLGDSSGNTFLSVDSTGFASFSGHSMANEGSGWRVSADLNGSPGSSDAIAFVGDPVGDDNQDGVANLVHHAVSGLDRDYVGPQFDLSGAAPVVTVTRNLAADDTMLEVEWSSDLTVWQTLGAPGNEVPSGDRVAAWSFTLPGDGGPCFVRLRASQ